MTNNRALNEIGRYALILLAVVMLLYYVYDRIVGIDNVKLG